MGTETASARFRAIDAWADEDIAAALIEDQFAAVAAVHAAHGALVAAAAAAAARLEEGYGRLVYAGAGSSGRIAVQDAAELPPTFGWPRKRVMSLLAGGVAALADAAEESEDDAAAGAAAVAGIEVGTADVLIAATASGGTAFTCAALDAAKRRGALTIGLANNPGTRLLTAADHPVLLDTGAEVVAGSTRLKAGTAQKVALNTFSTLLMIRLGHVHDGLMIDVEPGNAKLAARILHMVVTVAGVSEEAARRALAAAGGRAKPAILVLRGLSPAEANAVLARNRGRLRAALAALEEGGR